jgi:hypothetical protein
VTIKGTLDSTTPLPPTVVAGDMFIAGTAAPVAGWPGGLNPQPGNGLVFDGTKWTDVGSIRGPEGPAGAAGPAGPKGADGVCPQCLGPRVAIACASPGPDTPVTIQDAGGVLRDVTITGLTPGRLYELGGDVSMEWHPPVGVNPVPTAPAAGVFGRVTVAVYDSSALPIDDTDTPLWVGDAIDAAADTLTPQGGYSNLHQNVLPTGSGGRMEFRPTTSSVVVRWHGEVQGIATNPQYGEFLVPSACLTIHDEVGLPGPQGPAGPAGPKGDPGPAGGGTAFDPTPLNDAIAALTNRTNDNDARLNDLTDASPVETWSSTTVYPAGTVMRHNGKTWVAVTPTVAGQEPGVAPSWQSVTLESLLNRIQTLEARPQVVKMTQAAYDALAVKDPATLYAIVG